MAEPLKPTDKLSVEHSHVDCKTVISTAATDQLSPAPGGGLVL